MQSQSRSEPDFFIGGGARIVKADPDSAPAPPKKDKTKKSKKKMFKLKMLFYFSDIFKPKANLALSVHPQRK